MLSRLRIKIEAQLLQALKPVNRFQTTHFLFPNDFNSTQIDLYRQIGSTQLFAPWEVLATDFVEQRVDNN